MRKYVTAFSSELLSQKAPSLNVRVGSQYTSVNISVLCLKKWKQVSNNNTPKTHNFENAALGSKHR